MPTPQPTTPTPESLPFQRSAHPLPTSQDRSRLTLLYRNLGDTVNFIGSVPDADPFELLAWLELPHIKAWRQLIAAAFRENRQLETQRALSRAIRDISRVLDLEADSTLRIRAVTAITRLANALQRTSPSRREGAGGWVKGAHPQSARGPETDTSTTTALRLSPDEHAATEIHRAHDRVEGELSRLSIHMERIANHTEDLQDLKAPLGTPPSWARPCEPATPPSSPASHPNAAPAPTPLQLNGSAKLNSHPKPTRLRTAGCPIPPPSKRKRTRRPPPRRKPRAP